MISSIKSIKNQLKTVGRFPKFLALLGAGSLVLPVFSYAANAAAVQPTVQLVKGVGVLTAAASGHPVGGPFFSGAPLTSKIAPDGVILPSIRYSAALNLRLRHRSLTTATTMARRTTTTAAPTTTVPPTTSTTVVTSSITSTTVAPTTAAVAPIAITTAAPTTTTTVGTNKTATSDAQYRLDLGLEVKSGLWDAAPAQSVESAIGYKISIVMGYIGWSYPASESYASQFPTAQLEALSNDGYLPEITWEPWYDSSGVNQPNYSLASIIEGNYDSYIQSWAKAAKAYGKPILIRFAEEMNGTWYPWSEQVNGNSPGEYVQAWQHVHNIFTEDDVQNVKWVWSPNFVGSGASSDLAELYPGNAYVDYVGIDGYSYPNDGCPAASELFGPTLAIINQLSDRSVMIAETGIDSACSSQTSLMASLLNWTSANSRIIALTFFDRVTSSENYSLTPSLEQTIHSFVSPVTMRSDNPDGFQS